MTTQKIHQTIKHKSYLTILLTSSESQIIMDVFNKTFNENMTADFYLLIIESEEYWNIERIIFATLLIFIIFSSFSLIMAAITPLIISNIFKETNPGLNVSNAAANQRPELPGGEVCLTVQLCSSDLCSPAGSAQS